MKRTTLILTLFLALLLLTGCGGEKPPALTATAAYFATANAALTQVAEPTATPQPTWTASPTATLWTTKTPSPAVYTLTPEGSQPSATRGVPCNDATFLTDVTIPDNTVLDPGESFTKTWRLRNDGSCAWTTDYTVALVSGDALDGEAVPLPNTVPVNQTVDVSVALKAPLEAGTYTGNWTIRNENGGSFGDLFFVTIQVNVSATATAPASSTPEPSPSNPATLSPTPEPADTASPTPTPEPESTPTTDPA